MAGLLDEDHEDRKGGNRSDEDDDVDDDDDDDDDGPGIGGGIGRCGRALLHPLLR